MFDLLSAEVDLMPGEYGECGPGLEGKGELGYTPAPFNDACSSKYGELISCRDSDADVATDVRGACRD